MRAAQTSFGSPTSRTSPPDGFVYGAFVIDVFSRRIIGWRAARRCARRSSWTRWSKRSGRAPPKGVVHHSDRGGQYLSIRYSERLAEIGAQHRMCSSRPGAREPLLRNVS